jgi:5-methyltetrahydrofolate--homocysteine methyltransferase
MKGKFPDILNNPSTGEEARKLYDDAQDMLDRLIEGKWVTARAVVGFVPARAVGDDVELLDDSRTEVRAVLHQLRQQGEHRAGVPNRCLSDFIAPKETGLEDHVGAFAVTAGIGLEDKVKEFRDALDDYSAIMVEALADRLAEAFAERLHERVRKEFWGHEDDESLSNEDLIAERYRGIRPAFGYPACPDHSLKRRAFELLGAQELGIDLTEHGAMLPAASVSGLYIQHPAARYFNVGQIGKDQVEDYARRLGESVTEAERWLRTNLAYDPD